MKHKLGLELSLVLPSVPGARDACVQRLLTLLKQDGVERAHVAGEDSRAKLCVHYDPDRFDIAELRRLVLAAGSRIEQRYRHQSVRLDGMDCPTCATVVEHALGRLPGVLEAKVSYAAERLRLEYDGEAVGLDTIEARVQALGYKLVPPERLPTWFEEHRELLFSLASGLLLLAGWLAGRSSVAPPVPLLLLLGAYAAGGFFTLRDAWQSLFARRFDIDTLMIVAAAGAAALGAWEEGALLLFLFSLGHALEHLAMDRARAAVEKLGELAPDTAVVQREGVERELPVEELERGDRVVVKPGERIPADGVIAAGASSINQAAITGESVPVTKEQGESVFAGTVNGEGSLVVEVTKLPRESTLSRMVQLATEAQTERSPTQRFTDRFERVFVPAVLIGAVLLIALPSLFGIPFAESFYRAMAVLVAASPCALAIATPAAVLSAVARAARGGVLIKGGKPLETLGAVRAIAFDKTGTITLGKPRVTDVVALEGSENDLLALAASVESRSAHPLAHAVVAAARERGLSWPEVVTVDAVNGKGLLAQVEGKRVAVGNLKLFEGSEVPARVRDEAARLQAGGRTIMLVRAGESFAGLIGLADTPREAARKTLQSLRGLGIDHTIMLTGDNEAVGRAIGQAVGIEEVKAGLLPEDKVKAIEELLARYGQVAMIGDGVNDAPALARASVGIAMGGAGSDAALETADAALMGDDLLRLPFAVALSRAARRVIRQNVFLALGVVAILVPATLFGWAGIGPAVLAHEGSTVVVVLNALRLLAFRDCAQPDGTARAT